MIIGAPSEGGSYLYTHRVFPLTSDSCRFGGRRRRTCRADRHPLTQNTYSYTYVNGGPINLTDPTGHWACDDNATTIKTWEQKRGSTTGSWCVDNQCNSNGGQTYVSVDEYRKRHARSAYISLVGKALTWGASNPLLAATGGCSVGRARTASRPPRIVGDTRTPICDGRGAMHCVASHLRDASRRRDSRPGSIIRADRRRRRRAEWERLWPKNRH